MKIENWYNNNFEAELTGRYITLEMILPILDRYKNKIEITFPGISENGKIIPLIKIGTGKKVILAWSQMHGNESTTTKAIFDLLKFLTHKKFFKAEVEKFLSNNSLYIFPILNPDGAKLYTRENFNGVDLNRDAQNLSQSESRCLRQIFDRLKPQLCLNMHDQRSIFGLENGNPATVSFLSPAADPDRSITKARKTAMEHIVRMERYLQNFIPAQVGRFDDNFNMDCVGDTFQMLEVPTILFEAGHYKDDYKREKTREFIFYALFALLGFNRETESLDFEDYFQIPENQNNYRDIILTNVKVSQKLELNDVSIQYAERLEDEKIVFDPIVDLVGNLKNYYGHVKIDKKGSKIKRAIDKYLNPGDKIENIDDYLI